MRTEFPQVRADLRAGAEPGEGPGLAAGSGPGSDQASGRSWVPGVAWTETEVELYEGASELLDAVHFATEDKSYVTPLIAQRMIQSLAKPARTSDAERLLTGRQREVLRLLAEGKSMKEVAATLNLTVRTVAFHKYRMMQMLNIKSSAELVQYAVNSQLVAA